MSKRRQKLTGQRLTYHNRRTVDERRYQKITTRRRCLLCGCTVTNSMQGVCKCTCGGKMKLEWNQ